MLEKCALLKIALWSARARSRAAMSRTSASGLIGSVCLLRRVGMGTTAVGRSIATAPRGGRALEIGRCGSATEKEGLPEGTASLQGMMQDAIRARATLRLLLELTLARVTLCTRPRS